MKLTLVPFSPVDFIDSVVCTVDTTALEHGHKLNMTYVVTGDLRRINWPDEDDSEQELWRNTCFECFIGDANGTAYYELNQSPNGNRACYAFDDYRSGMRTSDVMVPEQYSMAKDNHECRVRLAVSGTSFGRICLGLSVVLKDVTAKTHYFSLSHPPSQPDFHDRQYHRIIDAKMLHGAST